MTAVGAAAIIADKKVISKNCFPFTNCISEINNPQEANANDTDVVMPMLREYSHIYLKKSGCLWQ